MFLPPLGTDCYGRRFGNFSFKFERGSTPPGAMGLIVDGRKVKSNDPFWVVMALDLEEPMVPATRATKVAVSNLYVSNPFALAHRDSNLLDVPRDEETMHDARTWLQPTFSHVTMEDAYMNDISPPISYAAAGAHL